MEDQNMGVYHEEGDRMGVHMMGDHEADDHHIQSYIQAEVAFQLESLATYNILASIS